MRKAVEKIITGKRKEIWLFASALLGESPEATNRRVDKTG